MKVPLFSKLLSKKKSDYLMAIDLGSSHVKAIVYRPPNDLEEKKILGVGLYPHEQGNMFGGQIRNLDAVIDATRHAIDEANLKAGAHSDDVILGLSGGVVFHKSLKVKTNRQDPDVAMSQSEFETVAEKIEEQTMVRAEDDLKDRVNGQLEHIETLFTTYMVDGAKVDTPLGITGKEVQIGLLHSFVEESRLRVIHSMIDQLGFQVRALLDSSLQSALVYAKERESFVLIDIGGNVTQMIFVIDGKIADTATLFMGGEDFTSEISNRLQVSFDRAEHIKLTYSQGHLDEDRTYQVKKAIEPVSEWLVEGLATAMAESSVSEVPGHLLLSGESRHLGEIKTSMSSFPWQKNVPIVAFPTIEIAEGKMPIVQALSEAEF